jgi:hypothetical protein
VPGHHSMAVKERKYIDTTRPHMQPHTHSHTHTQTYTRGGVERKYVVVHVCLRESEGEPAPLVHHIGRVRAGPNRCVCISEGIERERRQRGTYTGRGELVVLCLDAMGGCLLGPASVAINKCRIYP